MSMSAITNNQIKNMNALTEDEQIILDIVKNPRYKPPGLKQISWRKAVKDHPEWQTVVCYSGEGKQANKPDKAGDILKRLKKRGVYPGKVLAHGQGEEAQRPATPDKPLSELAQMVLEIARKYHKGNRNVGWTTAMKENPEIFERLGVTKKKMWLVYQALSDLRRKGLVPHLETKVSKTNGQISASPQQRVEPAPLTPEQIAAREELARKKEMARIMGQIAERVVGEFGFCNRCGKDHHKLLTEIFEEAINKAYP